MCLFLSGITKRKRNPRRVGGLLVCLWGISSLHHFLKRLLTRSYRIIGWKALLFEKSRRKTLFLLKCGGGMGQLEWVNIY